MAANGRNDQVEIVPPRPSRGLFAVVLMALVIILVLEPGENWGPLGLAACLWSIELRCV